MRWVLPLCVGMALACGGLSRPKKTVDRAGFSIELVDGDVETDDDFGSTGDYDVTFAFTTHAVSWAPIEEDDSLEDSVDLMWDGMSAIVAAGDDFTMPPKPAFEEGTVDGQRSLSFEADISIATIHSTTWRCPDAGLEVTLNTSGLSSAGDAHREALASVRCKHEPVEAVEGPRSFRFAGDPTGWIDDGDGTWVRADDLVTISVSSQPRLDEAPDDRLCEALMKTALGRMGDVVEIDPTQSRLKSTRGGCIQDFGGVRADDGAVLTGRLEHEGCGGRGYMAICVVVSGEPIDAACSGLVTCQ